MKSIVFWGGVMIAVLIGVLFTQPASAHVLIKSEDGNSAAILHIIPDDDPIAGEVANLMFDTQGGVLNDTSTITLTVTDSATGRKASVPVNRTDSLVSADYTFPAQGVYVLRYEVLTNNESKVFEQDTRVSRGVQGVNSHTHRHTWAEAGLIGVGIAFVVLVIIAWNKRHDIFAFSKL